MESQTELKSMKFQELLTKIGRKIRAHDVEIFKKKLKVTEGLPPSLLDDIDIRGKNSGLEFLKKLEKEGYLAKDNLELLKELLLAIERQDLLQELFKFEKKIKTSSDVEGAVARETEGYNIPPPILDMITPGRPPYRDPRYNIPPPILDMITPGRPPYRDPRRPPTPPSPLYPHPESKNVTINVEGGFHDLSSFGVLLQVPPNAVTHPTEMICRKIYPDLLLCATEENETLVSFCVEFESTSLVQLQKPIIVTLAHSGPSKKEGYETIVKELRDSWKKWKQIKEIQEDYPLAHEHLNSAYIRLEIMIGERKALAVVTRLITDTFEVTDKGCVVRSSVCEDVTLEFPEGAVDESSMGSLKLLLMPDHIDILDGMAAYPCPIIFIDGFEGVNFAIPVKIKLPHPYPEGYPTGNVRLLTMNAAHAWKDITNEVRCVETESFIELQVSHFSWLWAWTYEIPLTVASSLFKYLLKAPKDVCFAVFKENEVCSNTSLTMTLVVVPNHEQFDKTAAMKEQGYTQLASSTGNKKMRADDKAYAKVEGCYKKKLNEDIFLRFIEHDICRKELPLVKKNHSDTSTELVISFLEKKDGDSKDNLCKFCIEETRVVPPDISKKQPTTEAFLVQKLETVGLESAPPEPSAPPLDESALYN